MHSQYAKIGRVEIRVIEECSELIQAIAKAKRFGWKACHPVHHVDNTTRVLEEIADVRAVIDELEKWLRRGPTGEGRALHP